MMIDITYSITYYHDVLTAENIIVRFNIRQNEEVSYHYSSLTLQNY